MKKAILVCMCCLAALSTFADDNASKGVHFGTAKDTTDYSITAPRANWFFTVGGGVNSLIGDEYESSARYTGITPVGYIEVGKWVLPDVALVFNLSGFSLKGQTRYTLQPNVEVPVGYTMTSTAPEGYLPQYTPFKEYGFAANGRVMLDLTNFFCGFDKGAQKKWHVMLPVGFGLAYERGSFDNEHRKDKGHDYHGNFEYNATLGLENEFKVTDRFSIVNDIYCGVLRGSFDYSGAGPSYENLRSPSFDLLPTITLAARFDLSKPEVSTSKDGYAANEVGVNRYFANTNGLRDDLADAKAENEELKKELAEMQGIIDNLRNKPAEVKYVEKVLEPDPVIIYFKIDRWELLPEAKAILKSYAAVINASADDAKYYLIGGADSATGTSKRNVLLSNNRSRVAYDYLIKECGVNPNKLEKRALGGILEFDPIEMNRMTIVCPKTHRLAQIVDKWANETDNDVKK